MKFVKTQKHIPTTAPRFLSTTVFCLASLTALITMSRADAASFGVRVIDEQGQPLAGAAVCIGTAANPGQFGAFMTAADGSARIDNAPAVPLRITVSKEAFQGVHFEEPIRNWNLMTDVTLLRDGEGPVCDISGHADAQAADSERLKISYLNAFKSRAGYTIESDIQGAPTHYRVSHRKDFAGAKWQPYQKAVTYRGAAKDALYFQVKRFSGNTGSWLEARSAVADIAIGVN